MLAGLSRQTMPERTVGSKLTINIGNQLQNNENQKSQRILSDTTSTIIGTQFPNIWHHSDPHGKEGRIEFLFDLQC